MDTPHRTDTASPPTRLPATPPTTSPAPGLGAELRESLVLLAFAVGVTVGLTTVAQAALSALA